MNKRASSRKRSRSLKRPGKSTIYAGLGIKEEALQYLVKSYDEGSFYMIHLKVEPMLDPLRSDPRFADIVRRVSDMRHSLMSAHSMFCRLVRGFRSFRLCSRALRPSLCAVVPLRRLATAVRANNRGSQLHVS